MNADFIGRGLEDARDYHTRQRAELRAGPDVGGCTVLGHLRHRVHRLHLGVVGVFGPISRLHGLRGAVQAGFQVADLIFDFGFRLRILGLCCVFRLGFFRIECGGSGGAGVPSHLERLQTLPGRLHRVAYHRDPEWQRNDLGYAFHLHDVRNVNVLRLGAFQR